jgi:predicted dinucleotide-binding enzyme
MMTASASRSSVPFRLRVVKTLNTMSHTVMLNPSILLGSHNAFVSGESTEAKETITSLLTQLAGLSVTSWIWEGLKPPGQRKCMPLCCSSSQK